MKTQIAVIAPAILAILFHGLSGTIISKNRFAAKRAAYNGQATEDIVVDYCIAHADGVAAGENVVQDLDKSGLVPSYTCADKKCQEGKDLQSIANVMRYSELNAIIRSEPLDET